MNTYYTRLIFLFFLGSLLSCTPSSTQNPEEIPASFETTLISVEQNINRETWALSSEQLALENKAKWSIEKYRLKGGKQEGVDIIKVDNGAMTLEIVPTRGMNIFQVMKGDWRLGWDSPVKEVVNPLYTNLDANGGLGWLEDFNGWMVRCGLEFTGAPGNDGGRMLTLHGKVGHIPASEVRVIIDKEAPHRIRVRGRVDERWFKGTQLELWTEVSTIPGSNSLQIEDVLTNRADKDQEFMILYHANFGTPLLDKGTQLIGGVEKVRSMDAYAAEDVESWRNYSAPSQNKAEQVYCLFPLADQDGNTHFLIQNAAANKGVSFSYPKEQLPYLTQWKNENSLENGYVTGLEPGTAFPQNRSVERKYGRVPVLKPGESRTFSLKYALWDTQEEISRERDRIRAIFPQAPPISKEIIGK